MTVLATPSVKAKLLRVEKPGKTADAAQIVFWVCDNCDEHLYQPAQGLKRPIDYKYCPFCGARFES